MKRIPKSRVVNPDAAAAIMLPTHRFGVGFYRPGSPTRDPDGRLSYVAVVPELRPFWGMVRTTAGRSVSRLKTVDSRRVVGGTVVNVEILDAVELVHGPCTWSRTVERVGRVAGGGRVHVIIARRGNKRVALVAPVAGEEVA